MLLAHFDTFQRYRTAPSVENVCLPQGHQEFQATSGKLCLSANSSQLLNELEAMRSISAREHGLFGWNPLETVMIRNVFFHAHYIYIYIITIIIIIIIIIIVLCLAPWMAVCHNDTALKRLRTKRCQETCILCFIILGTKTAAPLGIPLEG